VTSVDSLVVWPVSSTSNTHIDQISIVTKELFTFPNNGQVWDGAGSFGRQTQPINPTRKDADPEFYLTTGPEFGDPDALKIGGFEYQAMEIVTTVIL
jgi:hypothetical protein